MFENVKPFRNCSFFKNTQQKNYQNLEHFLQTILGSVYTVLYIKLLPNFIKIDFEMAEIR